jgi:hypothetical protein
MELVNEGRMCEAGRWAVEHFKEMPESLQDLLIELQQHAREKVKPQ